MILGGFEFACEAVSISSIRYTKEEKEKLKRYHALHGNDWKKIAEMMSRSNLSVAMKYSEIKSRMYFLRIIIHSVYFNLKSFRAKENNLKSEGEEKQTKRMEWKEEELGQM